MKKLFVSHPHCAGESYWVHFKFAVAAGTKMLLAGVVCIVHAFLPFLFEHKASSIIIPLAAELSTRVEAIKSRKKHTDYGKK